MATHQWNIMICFVNTYSIRVITTILNNILYLGMEELLNDKDAFREAMQAAASMYENMDPDDLMQAMMGGMGGAGMPGMPPGFGADGTLPGMSSSPSALDELSEGED